MGGKRVYAVVVAALLGACGGGDGPTGPAAIASIQMAASNGVSKPLGAIGETITITATGKDAKGRSVDGQGFTWSTSNSSVATVSAGVVTATGNGNATITASAGSVNGTYAVTVTQVVSQLSVTLAIDTIRAIGATTQATATPKDSHANNISGKTATWTSTTPALVSVDGTGLVTAIAEGTATIRATIDGVQQDRVVEVRQRAAKLVITRQPSGARAGKLLTTQPIAEVQDAQGNRITSDNATLTTVSIASGGGSVVSGATATASSGVITFNALTIGGTAGAQTLRISATQVDAATSSTFALDAGDPAAIVVSSGSGQSAPANTALSQPLRALVRDGFNNPIGNAPVAWSVVGGGAITSPESATGTNGIASAGVTLPRHSGAVSVKATSTAIVGGGANAEAAFALTATPNGIIAGTVSGVTASLKTNTASAAVVAARRTSQSAQRAALQMPPSSTGSAAAVPGELLVTYKDSQLGAPTMGSSEYRQPSVTIAVGTAIRSAIGAAERRGIVSLRGVSPTLLTAKVQIQDGVTEAQAIAQLMADPRVKSVEPNAYMHIERVVPSSLESALLANGYGEIRESHLDRMMPNIFGDAKNAYIGGGTYPDNSLFTSQSWHYNMAGLPRAWELTQGSTNVVVSVVDDGIRPTHPAMAGVLTNDGYDFVSTATIPLCAGGSVTNNADGDGYDPDPTIPSSRSYNNAGTCLLGENASGNHGLHVSGTIGAVQGNSTGVIGVNWHVKIRMIRTIGISGSGATYDVAQGVLYAAGLPADNGAGGTVTAAGGASRIINMSVGGSSPNTALQNAVAQATAAGSLIIAAAGNNNSNAIVYPASLPGVLSVSALDPYMQRAPYSSYGPTVGIAAPGGATGQGLSSGVLSSTWNFLTGTPTYDSWQGTSMATPHVAGIAALLLAREPNLTGPQIRARLTSYAVDIGDVGNDQLFGAGIVNARNALTSSFGGARKLYVRLVNASNGAVVKTVAADNNGAYQFGELADGSYWVFAGQDEAGDGLLGMPVRTWSARGSASVPTSVVVDGADTYTANVSASAASETEPNNSLSTANELLADGYVMGDIGVSAGDFDYFRVRVATAGTYVFQASGLIGACGFAAESNPTISLLSAAGAELATNVDIDAAAQDYCARISMPLTPGDYYVRLQATRAGRYVLSSRRQ